MGLAEQFARGLQIGAERRAQEEREKLLNVQTQLVTQELNERQAPFDPDVAAAATRVSDPNLKIEDLSDDLNFLYRYPKILANSWETRNRMKVLNTQAQNAEELHKMRVEEAKQRKVNLGGGDPIDIKGVRHFMALRGYDDSEIGNYLRGWQDGDTITPELLEAAVPVVRPRPAANPNEIFDAGAQRIKAALMQTRPELFKKDASFKDPAKVGSVFLGVVNDWATKMQGKSREELDFKLAVDMLEETGLTTPEQRVGLYEYLSGVFGGGGGEEKGKTSDSSTAEPPTITDIMKRQSPEDRIADQKKEKDTQAILQQEFDKFIGETEDRGELAVKILASLDQRGLLTPELSEKVFGFVNLEKDKRFVKNLVQDLFKIPPTAARPPSQKKLPNPLEP